MFACIAMAGEVMSMLTGFPANIEFTPTIKMSLTEQISMYIDTSLLAGSLRFEIVTFVSKFTKFLDCDGHAVVVVLTLLAE